MFILPPARGTILSPIQPSGHRSFSETTADLHRSQVTLVVVLCMLICLRGNGVGNGIHDVWRRMVKLKAPRDGLALLDRLEPHRLYPSNFILTCAPSKICELVSAFLASLEPHFLDGGRQFGDEVFVFGLFGDLLDIVFVLTITFCG